MWAVSELLSPLVGSGDNLGELGMGVFVDSGKRLGLLLPVLFVVLLVLVMPDGTIAFGLAEELLRFAIDDA